MTGHHHHGPYEDIKASGSEDSCYGSNDLSRSSSSAHGVARPLLAEQHRSSSLSSTSVDYAVPTPRLSNNKPIDIALHPSISNADANLQQQQTNHLKTFHSPATTSTSQYNLKKTVQSLARRPIAGLQSTYLTYDSIDTPPSPPIHSSATSTTSREYSI